MHLHRFVLLTLVLLLTASQAIAFAGAKKRVRLSWSELGPVIADRKIAMTIAGGTAVKGTVLGVDSDALRVRVTWSSDRRAVRKGATSIPRSSVSLIRMDRYSKHWRLILTPGLPAAALGGIYFAAGRVSPTPDPVKLVKIALGVTVAATVTGYLVGNRLDRRELTEITVVPEAEPR